MQLCIEFQLRVLRSFWVKSPENMWLLFTVFSFIEITSSVYNTTLTFLFCKISSFLLGNQYFTPYLTPFISFDDICIQYLSRLQCHSFGSKQTHVRLDAHLVAMTTTCKQCVNAGMATNWDLAGVSIALVSSRLSLICTPVRAAVVTACTRRRSR